MFFNTFYCPDSQILKAITFYGLQYSLIVHKGQFIDIRYKLCTISLPVLVELSLPSYILL